MVLGVAVLVYCLVGGASAVTPVANFTANVTSGYPSLWVQFTDTSTGEPLTHRWKIEKPEGTWMYQSAGYHPTTNVLYTAPGTYGVELTVYNADGSDTVTRTEYITVIDPPAAPVAAFTADVVAGGAPLTVSFTDLSENTPTSWAWDFDGDGVTDSTDQDPSHIYFTEGNYTVGLVATNDQGADAENKTAYICVGSLTATNLVAAFRYSSSGGNAAGAAPLTVQFTDMSRSSNGGSYSTLWDFGDGNTSAEANPVHVYDTVGKYDVELRVTSDYDSAAEHISKAIMVYPDQADEPITQTTFGVHATELAEANFDPAIYGETLPKAYTDLMPITLVWGILFFGVFAMLFIRQGYAPLILLIGILLGGSIWLLVPPEWNMLGQGMAAVCLAAFLVTLFTGRRR
jgi:PKD repeat protein